MLSSKCKYWLDGLAEIENVLLFNRPDVSGAVLKSPPEINSVTKWWCVEIYSKHYQSQTERARELKFSKNIHPTLCVMCHVSRVTCHIFYILFYKKKKKRRQKKLCDTWHLTHDTWHVTHDMDHMTHGGGWTFFENFSSLALLARERQWFEYIFTKDNWLT